MASKSDPIVMDARKFLRTINSSAQSKVVFFEGLVKKLGDKKSKNYRLSSLNEGSLIFEDVDSSSYFAADVSKKDRKRVEINNIRPIKIVEDEKPKSFNKHCFNLVECLSNDDFKGADKAFRIIESQRFRSSVIPKTGWVTTKDRVARYVPMESKGLDIDIISETLARTVSDFLELDESTNTIRGVLPGTGEELVIPMSKMMERRRVASHMKSVAENAWRSDKFNSLIENVAGLVSKDMIKEAIQRVAGFLKENQEFSMLSEDETKQLVENSLSAVGEFNSILSENVGTLLYRVNAKVNRHDIVEAWEKTAMIAESAELLHRAKVLQQSKTFTEDYNEFLGKLFTEDDKALRADIARLRLMQNELAHSESDENTEIISQISDLIGRAEEDPDDLVKNDIRDLLSANDDKIRAFTTLANQDEISDDGISAVDEVEGPVGPPQEVPEGGGSAGLGGGLDLDLGGEEPGQEAGETGEEDLNLELDLPESKNKPSKTLIEDMSIADLKYEIDHWKTDGHIYLAEDGFENCYNQFARYIKRCDELGAEGLKGEFEGLRDVMVNTGNDVIDETASVGDPYSSIDVGDKVEINEEYGAAKMDPPKGSGVAEKGKEPGYAGKGSAPAGDPKMGSPSGKGVATKSGEATASPGGGTDAKMDSPEGEGVQKKGLGDSKLSHGNEDGPDAGKPKTGGAQMDSPDGSGLAESAGNPEKMQPGTGKIIKGSWIDKLDAKMTSDLPDASVELSKEKHGKGDEHPQGSSVAEDKTPNPVSVAGEKRKEELEKKKKEQEKGEAEVKENINTDDIVETCCMECQIKTVAKEGDECPECGKPMTAMSQLDESQYKGAKGFRGIGMEKGSINEEESESEEGSDDISEDVAVMVSTDSNIDDVIDAVVKSMEEMGDIEMDEPEAITEPVEEPGEEPEVPEVPEGPEDEESEALGFISGEMETEVGGEEESEEESEEEESEEE